MIQSLSSSAASVGSASQPLLDRAQPASKVEPARSTEQEAATRTSIDTVAQGRRASIRALNGGLSIVQGVDNAAEQVQERLVELRQLATKAASNRPGSPDEPTLLEQTEKLKEEINALAEDTSFSGFNLTDGSQAALEIRTDLELEAPISIPTPDLSTESLGIDEVDLSTINGARAAVRTIDAAIEGVDGVRLEVLQQEGILAAAARFDIERAGALGATPLSDRAAAAESAAEANVQLRDAPDAARQLQTQTLSRDAVSVLLA
ncbi:MAG: hypothetical protein CL927_14715 [Deltaproteobacteria bacterium]|nr:hypothetical protein [Deltaproteobacteria bacterium]HCH65970.1 hypothetical protein [Deltaproteobacteria bacterium]